MKILDIVFERDFGVWKLILTVEDADGVRIIMTPVPFEMIAELAPPCVGVAA